MTIREFTVPLRGVGKPDYSKEISSGLERAGLSLKYNQTLKIFARTLSIGDPAYPIAPVNPLAVGDSTHLTDLETNVPLPTIIPAGYTLTLLDYGATVSEDCQVYSYFENGIVTSCFVVMGSGGTYYVNRIVGFSTTLFDEDAEDPHTLDIKLYNRGGGALYGGVTVNAIVEKVGSEEWPTTKECECPYCENRQGVPITTTKIICTNCGKLYVVYNLSKFRGSA